MKNILCGLICMLNILNTYSQDTITSDYGLMKESTVIPDYLCKDTIRLSFPVSVFKQIELTNNTAYYEEMTRIERNFYDSILFLEGQTLSFFNNKNCYEYKSSKKKFENTIITYYDTIKTINEIIGVKKKTKQAQFIRNGIYIKLSKNGTMQILGEYNNNNKSGQWYWFNENKVVYFKKYSKLFISKFSKDRRCGCAIR